MVRGQNPDTGEFFALFKEILVEISRFHHTSNQYFYFWPTYYLLFTVGGHLPQFFAWLRNLLLHHRRVKVCLQSSIQVYIEMTVSPIGLGLGV